MRTVSRVVLGQYNPESKLTITFPLVFPPLDDTTSAYVGIVPSLPFRTIGLRDEDGDGFDFFGGTSNEDPAGGCPPRKGLA